MITGQMNIVTGMENQICNNNISKLLTSFMLGITPTYNFDIFCHKPFKPLATWIQSAYIISNNNIT